MLILHTSLDKSKQEQLNFFLTFLFVALIFIIDQHKPYHALQDLKFPKTRKIPLLKVKHKIYGSESWLGAISSQPRGCSLQLGRETINC